VSGVTLENDILTADSPQKVKVWGTVLEPESSFSGKRYTVDPDGTLRVYSKCYKQECEIEFLEKNEFKFTIDTRQTANDRNGTSTVFYLPLLHPITQSGSWLIDWGDGTEEEFSFSAETVGYDTSASPNNKLHDYAGTGGADEYHITIRPKFNEGGWFTAFGFNNAVASGGAAALQENRNKIVSLDSPLTPSMFFTYPQIESGNCSSVSKVLCYAFYFCKGVDFTMGEDFGFSSGWDRVHNVGADFLHSMFFGCDGNSFTMNDRFTIPQSIMTAGENFLWQMFYNCTHDNFQICPQFKFPSAIPATASNSFYRTFDTNINKSPTFARQIKTTPANIVNGCAAPNGQRSTFYAYSVQKTKDRWGETEINEVPANWRGAGV